MSPASGEALVKRLLGRRPSGWIASLGIGIPVLGILLFAERGGSVPSDTPSSASAPGANPSPVPAETAAPGADSSARSLPESGPPAVTPSLAREASEPNAVTADETPKAE